MALPNQKTFLNFQEELSYEVLGKIAGAVAGDDDRPSLTQIKQHINDAYQRVCASHDWSWLYRESTFSTVVDQTTPYTLTISGAAVAEVMWMTIPAKNRRLAPVSQASYRAHYPSGYTNQGSGIPQFYVETYNDANNELSFLLGPSKADDVYTVNFGYKLVPGVMSTDGAVPVVPAQWQELIKLRALMDIYRALGPGSKERYEDTKAEFGALWAQAWLQDQSRGEFVRAMRDKQREAALYSADANSVLWNG